MAKKSRKPATPDKKMKSCPNEKCKLFGKPVADNKTRTCPECKTRLPNIGKTTATSKVSQDAIVEAIALANEVGYDEMIKVFRAIKDPKKFKSLYSALPTLEKINERKQPAE